MFKKVLVFLTATLFLILVGLLVIYFYSHRSINKQNSILNFIPQQTDLVIRIRETSTSANEFFNHPLVKECFDLRQIQEYWRAVDSVTSRNYKTAEVLQQNTSYICMDSTSFLILVDLNKKTNEHFIDQFLSNSTNHRTIEKFKEGYKAFYPQEGNPMYYFTKHNVFGVSNSPEFLINSLANSNLERSDSLIALWDHETNANISIWGKAGTESSVLDSFISADIFFNGWLDQLSTHYFLDVDFSKNELEFSGQLMMDSIKLKASGLMISNQPRQVLRYNDTAWLVNKVYSIQSNDSSGKACNLVYTYHQFKDSTNNIAHLLVSKTELANYLFSQAIEDTSVQLIEMADERISKMAVMNWQTARNIIPIIPIKPDTGHLFVALYNDYFLLSNNTQTVLLAVPLIESDRFIKESLDGSVVLSGSRSLATHTNIRSEFAIRSRNGVIAINCVFRSNTPD